MTQPESRLSSRIQTALRKEGAFVFKVHGDEYTMAGVPDLVGCYRGIFFGFETKMPGKRENTSKRQRLVMDRIGKAQGWVAVVESIGEAIEQLRAIDSLLDE